MKKVLLLLTLFSFFKPAAQIINIPDAAFKYRLTHGYPNYNYGYDTNHDGEIDQAEANAITNLNLSNVTAINDITGVRNFTNLTALTLFNTRLSNIDVHDMPNLKTLYLQYNPIHIGNINVSGCPNLEVLTALENPLHSVTLSGAVALKKVEIVSSLLEEIDLTGLSTLIEVNLSKSTLRNVTLGDHPYLKSFNVSYSYSQTLESLDFSGCPSLETFSAYQSGLGSVRISNKPNLRTVSCGNNNLKTLDLNGNTMLTTLNCSSNQIESLTLDNVTQLKSVDCSENNIAVLDIKNNKDLKSFSCAYNQIKHLDLRDMNPIDQPQRQFDLSHNQLETLQVQNTEINMLICGFNRFRELDLSQRSRLIYLDCGNNPNLAYINLTGQDNSPILSNPNIPGIVLDNNYNLFYVCIDSWQVYRLKNYANTIGLNPKISEDCQIRTLAAPNPVRDHVVLYNTENLTLVNLRDSSGKLLQKFVPETNTHYIDMVAYPPGIYLLEITTESGYGNGTKKIVKM